MARILVVEDESAIAELVAINLRHAGHEVTVATDADRAQLDVDAVLPDLVVLDLRSEAVIYAGNRFVVYAMYPQCDISMHVMWGREKLNTVYTVGKSIFDRGNKLMVGELMLNHGGGGHHADGTCQGDNETADEMTRGLNESILSLSLEEAAHA